MRTTMRILVVIALSSAVYTPCYAACGAGNEDCLVGRLGDVDLDGDVDRDDYAQLEGCLSGPGGGPVEPDCLNADTDGDGAVDLSDYADLASAFTGACSCPPNATPPSALFDAEPFLGEMPLEVVFDAGRTWDAEAVIRLYEWDFGDGSTASGVMTSHMFTLPGDHVVTLTVTDGGGLVGQMELVVSVSDGTYDITAPVTDNEARRFLWQAGFGPDPDALDDVIFEGYEGWIDSQIAAPSTRILAEYIEYHEATFGGTHPGYLWDDICIEAPDQLRQRVAWALIQIVVNNASQNGAGNYGNAHCYSEYVDRAFGNYRDLLDYVTHTHQMGRYLTYMGNRKADPVAGTAPDENYARELLQLFSIGMWELDADGTRLIGADGAPIPTYDNEDVKQFARIFTGLERNNDIDWEDVPYHPMKMYADRHEFGDKQLLDYPDAVPPAGYVPAITDPADQTQAAALQDIQDALDNAFHHPNCAPFIGRQLIQRFVTSNPTPAYVQRVAAAFEGNGPYGSGTRGDLAATIKAILLDDEARDPAYRSNPLYGLVKEPLVTRWGLYRILERFDRPGEDFPYRIAISPWNTSTQFGQAWMDSPSVFNFYPPDYVPPGSNLVLLNRFAPELGIYNDYTAMSIANRFRSELVMPDDEIEAGRYEAWRYFASTPAVLVDVLNDELMFGTLSAEAQQLIADALEQIDDDTERVRGAVWLIALSPEFRVLR